MTTTLTALHPQAAAHLAATAEVPGVATMSVAEARLAGLGYLQLQRPAPALAHVEHRFVPGPTADLPIRVLRPRLPVSPTPAVIVLHGSGWVIYNLDVVDEPARRLAVDTGFTVITVNYQKAPEHRFPVPLDDCVAAIRWVHAHASELGVDPDRLAVVGDSAGGKPPPPPPPTSCARARRWPRRRCSTRPSITAGTAPPTASSPRASG
jgi:acetyl esterase